MMLASKPKPVPVPEGPRKPIGKITILEVRQGWRKIPLSYSRHIRGFHPVRPDHDSVAWEGLCERDTISVLASFPELKKIQSQPCTVFYLHGNEKHRYTVDFSVALDEVPPALETLGFQELTYVECKPDAKVAEQRDKIDLNFRAFQLATGKLPVLITDSDLLVGALGDRL